MRSIWSMSKVKAEFSIDLPQFLPRTRAKTAAARAHAPIRLDGNFDTKTSLLGSLVAEIILNVQHLSNNISLILDISFFCLHPKPIITK